MTATVTTVVLLLANALFVGSEFAVIASRRTVLEPRAANSLQVRWALSAMNQLQLMTTGAQMGITVCALGLGAIAEPALARRIEPLFESAGLPSAMVHPAALVIALTFVVYLHTVLGEMVPKNIVLAGPERCVVWLGPMLLAFCIAIKPFLEALTTFTAWILRWFNIDARSSSRTVYTASEFAGMAAESRTEGLLDNDAHARMAAALSMSERTASDILLPWGDVVTVGNTISAASLELLANRTGHSRFPVIDHSEGRVIGFVHVKDGLSLSGADRRSAIPATAVRRLPLVPPERNLADLLVYMRRHTVHIVMVGQGVTPLGVVTLDDVLAAVIGGPAYAESD